MRHAPALALLAAGCSFGTPEREHEAPQAGAGGGSFEGLGGEGGEPQAEGVGGAPEPEPGVGGSPSGGAGTGGAPEASGGSEHHGIDECPGDGYELCAAAWCEALPTQYIEPWPCESWDVVTGACEPEDAGDYCCCPAALD